jgi:hypothetical protein
MGGTRIQGRLTAARLTVALALVAAACGGPATPGTSAEPSPTTAAIVPTTPPISAGSSAEPSIEPSIPLPTPTPTTGPTLPAGSYAHFREFRYVDTFVMRVAVNDLNVRRKPATSGISEGKARKGDLFMFYDWPITANGYTWYFGYVQLTDTPGVIPSLPAPYNTGYDEVLAGWMATGTEDTPFLVPVGPRCPDVRDLLNVGNMLGSERVACFGADSLTLEGIYGCEGCGGAVAGTFEPGWLASPLDVGFLSTSLVDPAAALSLHFAPAGPPLPAQGARLRARGHFADARSPTCRITEFGEGDEPGGPIANAAAEQWCRSKFVVESYEVIG